MSARLEGIVLRKKTLREYDLLLSVFSRTDGRLLLCKTQALKKPQAELDLLVRNEFIVSEPKDFGVIYQVSGLDLFAGIRRSYVLLQAAADAVKIIERLTVALQPNPGLYQLLHAYLQALDSATDTTALPALQLAWYKNILLNEGIYDGREVSARSFQRQIADYRG